MAVQADSTAGFVGEVSTAQTPDVFGRGVRYAVGGGGDLKVTAGGAGSRSITVAAGKAWGDAVLAFWTSGPTVLNATENAGSTTRWDTLVVRRDWEDETATLTLLAGGSSQALASPGVVLRNPTPSTGAGYTAADQPIALVGVPVGATSIADSNIIDLRLWAGEGGGLYGAHSKARDYITSVGTTVRIGDVLHTRYLDGTGTPQWSEIDLTRAGGARFDASGVMVEGTVPLAKVDLDDSGWVSSTPSPTNYSGVTATRRAKSGWGVLKITGTRSSGSISGVDSTFLTLPAGIRPSERVYGQATVGSDFYRAYVEGNGDVHVNPFTITAGQSFQVYITWPIG